MYMRMSSKIGRGSRRSTSPQATGHCRLQHGVGGAREGYREGDAHFAARALSWVAVENQMGRAAGVAQRLQCLAHLRHAELNRLQALEQRRVIVRPGLARVFVAHLLFDRRGPRRHPFQRPASTRPCSSRRPSRVG